MDAKLLPQHKRLAMGLPVNTPVSTTSTVIADNKKAANPPKVERPRERK